MSKTPAEPSLELFPAGGPGATARRVFFATRPKFLTASVLPVLVGTAMGSGGVRHINWITAGLAVLATALAHAATNVYNDVGDDINGTDSANVDRIFPYTGGSRFIQNGVLTKASALRIAVGFGVAALVAGALLTSLRGPAILAFGLVGLALGLFYSQPGVQLSGRGLGELACGLGLGMLPVVGAGWLQSDIIDANSCLVGGVVSMWVALILLINEAPDRDADARAGKHTLVVRLGTSGAATLYVLQSLAVLAMIVLLVVRGALSPWAGIPVAGLAVAGVLTGRALTDAATNRAALRALIERTLGIHAVGCTLLIVGLLLR